jgi:hypothetical protein
VARGAEAAAEHDGVEWAEANRKLFKESSNGGQFIVARVEVARGPMLWATEMRAQARGLSALSS